MDFVHKVLTGQLWGEPFKQEVAIQSDAFSNQSKKIIWSL